MTLSDKMPLLTATASARATDYSDMRTALYPASLALTLLAAALPAAAQAPTLAMLDTLEAGQWQIRDREGSEPARSICMRDARVLIQLQHPRGDCSRYVIDDGAAAITVHYTCPGAGHGRTTIRRETARLVQVDTQGIASSAPFSAAYEARRTGPCS